MINMDEFAIRGGTMCLSKAGLAEGTNDATIKTAAPNGAGIDYMIDGAAYHKADTDNISPTTCTAQTTDTTCIYLVMLDTSGTLSVTKGDEVTTANLTAGTEPLVWPTPTANTCPIGYIHIATSGGTFQVGVDDITTDVGSHTITIVDLCTMPVAPLTS